MVSFSHCAVPTSHVTVFSYIWWFPYFFLTFHGSILTLYSFKSHVTVLLSHLMVPLLLFLHLTVPSSRYVIPISHVTVLFLHLVVPLLFFTFDSFILTLCSSNITCVNSFVIFDDSLFFFSHLTVPSSHYIIPTSHLIVLFSHLVVHLFIFLTFDDSIITLCNFNITFDSTFVIYSGSLIIIIIFLKFDGVIVILSSTNIASVLFLSLVTVFFSHLVVPLLFSHI